MTTPDSTPALTSDYAKVYSAALDEEIARPVAERTRFSHTVAADAVAVHAFLDAALALDESGLDAADAAAYLRARAETMDTGKSSTLRRHKATQDIVAQMTPAYAAYVTQNSPAAQRRLAELVGEEAVAAILDEFDIVLKGA